MFKLIFLLIITLIVFVSSNKLFETTKFYHISPRVIGGKETKPNSAPFMVSIQDKPNSSKKLGLHYCGGVILDANWILTAAHCLSSENNVKNSILVAGAHNIEINDGTTTQIRKIDFYKKHKLYNGGTSPYDLALIYTKNKFDLNKYVQAISLPAQNSNPIGQGTLYGWGSISMTEKPLYPNKLHSVDIPIIQSDECKRALGSMGIYVHNTNICTGPLTGGKGICQADSGGPLIQKDKKSKKDIVIGIVSWGKMPCGQANSPSVFVRVSAFIDWIKNIQINGPK